MAETEGSWIMFWVVVLAAASVVGTSIQRALVAEELRGQIAVMRSNNEKIAAILAIGE